MTINERAGLTDNAWVERIGELRNDLEAQYSAMSATSAYAEVAYAEVAEWMLSDDVDTEYDLDDADFLRRDALRKDNAN